MLFVMLLQIQVLQKAQVMQNLVLPRLAGNAGSDTARDRVKDMADTIPTSLTVVKDLQDVKYILVILV